VGRVGAGGGFVGSNGGMGPGASVPRRVGGLVWLGRSGDVAVARRAGRGSRQAVTSAGLGACQFMTSSGDLISMILEKSMP